MANFSNLIITDAGKQLLNQKLYSQEELTFTEMVMSERRYDTALESLTELEEIRQRAGIRKMAKEERGVRIGSVFLNSDLEEGYFANTLGLYARHGEEEPVLFAVAAEQMRAAFMPPRSRTLCGMEIRLKITLENTDHITIQVDQSAMATVGDVLELEKSIQDHTGNADNPHRTTKEQVGLGEADNTADRDKPVSTAQRAAIDDACQQATGYTDTRIGQLIDGAPSTLDTLGEIAQAMKENADVVQALDQAIGTRASQAEVDGHTGNDTIHITASERQTWNSRQTTTGDTGDNTVSFTSGDAASPAGWADVDLITSGEKHSSLWRKVSLFAKNVRYLWKLLGSTSLSGIGDGTVTGAISALNTGLRAKANSSHTHYKSQITDFPSALPASDVYAWAKAASKPGYNWNEIGNKPGTFTPSTHTHAFADITGKPRLGQWLASCGATSLNAGQNIPLSALISVSGWFFVTGMIRFATDNDSINVGLYISVGSSGEFSEPWSGSQSARGVRRWTNMSGSRVIWINAGTYINLSCYASANCEIEGARIEYSLLCSY